MYYVYQHSHRLREAYYEVENAGSCQESSPTIGSAVAHVGRLSLGLGSTARAATLTVTKTADTNDGLCDADCSLREATGLATPPDADQRRCILPSAAVSPSPHRWPAGFALGLRFLRHDGLL